MALSVRSAGVPEWPTGIIESPLGRPRALATVAEIEFALACYQLIRRQRTSHNGLAWRYTDLQRLNPLLPSLDEERSSVPERPDSFIPSSAYPVEYRGSVEADFRGFGGNPTKLPQER
jgi:hypothetical protein